MRSLVGKTLYEVRRSTVAWMLELAGIVVLIVAIYPSLHDVKALADLGKSFPKGLTSFAGYGGRIDYTSPVGFLGTELFTVTLPLILLFLEISAGARAIASEEEHATLDLLLANPISRRRVVLEKAAANAVQLALFALAIFASLAIATRAWDVPIAVSRLGAASVFVALLAGLFGALALAVGAATGRHDLAVGVPAGLAALSYIVNGVGPLVSWLEPFAKATPFHAYSEAAPLLHGFRLGPALALFLPALALLAVAVAAFDRRDLR
jgi:beta-exotoxin I transport system permease protein